MAIGTLVAVLKVAVVDVAPARRRPAPVDGAPTLRIVHGNVFNGHAGPERIGDAVLGDEADVLAFSEWTREAEIRALADRVLPGATTWARGNRAIVTRFPIEHREAISLHGRQALFSTLRVDGRELDVLFVDLPAAPWIDRWPHVGSIEAWLRGRSDDRPLIVLGDFNTPRDSRTFRGLRERLDHAYELGGAGWPYTWPVPIPVRAVDHLWVSNGIRVHEYRLRASPWSDHSRQVTTLSLAGPSYPGRHGRTGNGTAGHSSRSPAHRDSRHGRRRLSLRT